ncbi:MAG: undecaprenyl-phosphate alpha-N-acetylglucosaminyl 1-phosphate transferase [Clostridiales bacterium GWE2_32_10]|nr:MAG: undecaprenyl-phosphate alpha-N-acetylglucosaminyl 1-phosphate transferase [Clostridiales bacterium GWE2_32_10]HBY19589.1 undecaprenyl-phosphate alpha-N-acetylglucosaminyl 1-phosphate transferase [Clostridiales bacterium]
MDLKLYLVALFTAFIVTYMSTPLSKWISIKIGAVAYPRARDMHTKPTPRMGGIAIVIGFMATILIFTPMVNSLDMKKVIGIIIGGTIIFLIGFFDDIMTLKAKQKLFFQILAATIVVACGVKIDIISWPTAVEGMVKIDSNIVSMIISILWIVGVSNAVNLIDGLDGLAAGVSSIAAICLMILAIIAGNEVAIIITIALVGSCLGFLPYNFNPAKIFMGDTGALFLGFILSITSILGLFKGYMIAALIVPIIVLGLPIFDTTFAICRRIATGKPIMSPDRGHIHHKLIDRGLSHRNAVLTLYAISISFGVLGILVAQKSIYYGLGVFVLLMIVTYIVTSGGKEDSTK